MGIREKLKQLNKESDEDAERVYQFYKKKVRPKLSKAKKGINRVDSAASRGVTRGIRRLAPRKPLTLRQIEAIRQNFRQMNRAFTLSPEQRRYNFVFNCGDQAAPLVERELTSMNHVNVGDIAAGQLDREAFAFGNTLSAGFNPVAQIEGEVWRFGAFENKKPVRKVSMEADFFSNIIP